MLVSNSEFFILLIVSLTAIILLNPLILLEGFSKLLRRQKKMPSVKEIEQKLLSCHQKSLEKMEQQVQTEVKEEMAAMANRHEEVLAKLGARPALEEATKRYLEETKLALDGVVNRTEKRVNDELAGELKKALTEIENYKEGRLKKIDNEIATIVEKTIYKTLGKGLSLEDHIDLIHESLAEAKEEGFFGKNAK